MKAKDFFKSQNMFLEWRAKEYTDSLCMFQVFNFKIGLSIEKWKSFNKDINKTETYLVELYPDGNGFSTYHLK